MRAMADSAPPPEQPAPRRSNPLADLLANLALLAVAAGLIFLAADAWIPPQHLPWTPLRIGDPPGAATGVKLMRIEGDRAACRAVLAEGGVRTADRPDRPDDRGEAGFCALENVLTVEGGTTPLRPAGPVLTCPVALSYAIWERQVVRPAALEILGSELAAIAHYGAYACRRVGGGEAGRPSEHATANALDVAAFRLRDGRQVSVAADWSDEGPEGRFLRAVRDGACGPFEAVLGPEYNAAHRDHFHLDRGPYRVCR
jgi:hypothetical protein